MAAMTERSRQGISDSWLTGRTTETTKMLRHGELRWLVVPVGDLEQTVDASWRRHCPVYPLVIQEVKVYRTERINTVKKD